MPLALAYVCTWGVNMGWVPGYVYPADLSRVLVFQRQVPVRPSRCTATSTAPGAKARPHDGLACQVSAATVLGKGSHGRRFHSTIDAPRPLLGGFVTNRGTGPQDSICVNFAMRKLQIHRVDFHPFVSEHGRERGHYGSLPGGFRWNQRRTPVGRVREAPSRRDDAQRLRQGHMHTVAAI